MECRLGDIISWELYQKRKILHIHTYICLGYILFLHSKNIHTEKNSTIQKRYISMNYKKEENVFSRAHYLY